MRGYEGMSATISVAKDVIHKLDRFKEEAAKVTGKEKPSYSDVIRLLIARHNRPQGSYEKAMPH